MTKRQTVDPIEKIKSTRGLAMRIAEVCGIARTAVYQWKKVPANRVMQVAPLLKMRPKDIRPDVFGG